MRSVSTLLESEEPPLKRCVGSSALDACPPCTAASADLLRSAAGGASLLAPPTCEACLPTLGGPSKAMSKATPPVRRSAETGIGAPPPLLGSSAAGGLISQASGARCVRSRAGVAVGAPTDTSSPADDGLRRSGCAHAPTAGASSASLGPAVSTGSSASCGPPEGSSSSKSLSAPLARAAPPAWSTSASALSNKPTSSTLTPSTPTTVSGGSAEDASRTSTYALLTAPSTREMVRSSRCARLSSARPASPLTREACTRSMTSIRRVSCAACTARRSSSTSRRVPGFAASSARRTACGSWLADCPSSPATSASPHDATPLTAGGDAGGASRWLGC
eukprot:7383492-Prymnesium_polylepis.3